LQNYFQALLENVIQAHILARRNEQTLECILNEVKELRKMADERLAAIDTELDGEDTILTQIETDLTGVTAAIADLTTQEAALEAEIAAGTSTVDTTAEVQRIQAEKARLTAIEGSLSAQIAAHTPVVPPTNPNPAAPSNPTDATVAPVVEDSAPTEPDTTSAG
jgi:peptidoglycan hydrolase CwlO-like protein